MFVKCLIPQDSARHGRSRTKWWLIGALVILAGGQSSCGPVSGLNSGGSSRYQIPFPDESGAYALREVEIPGFTDPSSLRGAYAEILVDPNESGGIIQGATPVGRYLKTSSGLMVATNYVSRVATAVHAHSERLYRLDREAGVQQNLISWPVKVGVEANVIDSKDQTVARSNALFDHRLNALLLVPYSKGFVPIGMNAGILAHEHFHRIFEGMILTKLPSIRKPDPGTTAEFNRTVLLGMNEGFADFWAWVYTGDPDFIQISLPNESVPRSLKAPASEFMSKELVEARINEITYRALGNRKKGLDAIAYQAGTLYARFMRELTMNLYGSSREDRMEGARLLIRALPAILEDARQAADMNSQLDPKAFLKSLKATVELTPATCRIFERASGTREDCR